MTPTDEAMQRSRRRAAPPGVRPGVLAPEYIEHFRLHAGTIDERLGEFSAVPESEYLYELLYCILTPQSRARHAEETIAELRRDDFLARRFDPTPYLRNPAHYIRFHNQKARRLLAIANDRERILSVLCAPSLGEVERRSWLCENVGGLGLKEASHFLRNIGARDLAIIDRHILKHLLRCGALEEIPRSLSERRYLEIERAFDDLARKAGLTLQQLDLLFWSFEEGSVRK